MEISVKIDLGKIRQNIIDCGKRVILMVKADAYGHGLVEVSRCAEDIVEGFGVATVEEGATLRKNGVTKGILVAQWLENEVLLATKYDLTLSVTNFHQLDMVKSCGLKGHLKINTGMNRFGFDEEDLSSVKNAVEGYTVDGIYSHVYSAESEDNQRKVFDRAVEYLDLGTKNHLYSSNYLAKTDDIIRLGIGAYKGAITVSSVVVGVKSLRKGDNVGYGKQMPHDGNVVWIFGGYADGINRENPPPVLLGGKLTNPVAVCMDTFAVYTGDYLPKIGEEVILQNNLLTEDKIAKYTNTVPYTVMVARRGRVKRIYL